MEQLLSGLAAFSDPPVLLSTLVGVVAGIFVGLVPGFTITMGVILVLPFTFGMTPLQGIATMMGVAVGGASGGLISACLIGIPGTPSAVATTFDGFPMARKGEPGRALGLGTWASLFGGIIGWVVLAAATAPLADFGLKFGPWEMFSLVAFSITMIASLSGDSLTKGLIAGLLGMLLATIGLDPVLNIARFSFGNADIESGFDFLPVLIGLFGFSQLMSDLERRENAGERVAIRLKDIRIPHLQVLRDIWRSKVVLLWSSIVGAWIGVVPAAGGSIANVLAYDQAKKVSRHREKFGTGHYEGIIASEAGNNSVSAGDLVPMLALGIPGDAVTAVMLGALLIHGVQPGPQLMTDPRTATLAWGVIAGYLVATILTLFIQIWGMRLFARLVFVPYHVLVPGILVLSALGAIVLNNRVFDVFVLLGFGIIGYFMVKNGFPLASFVLGFLLGPLAEINLRRALQTDPNLVQFALRPISALLLGLAVLAVAYYFWVGYRRVRSSGEPAAA
ncbi:MAG TPA: tripartite tricarboxylate transporter permease [Candidatus Limnocylindria bacterium]|jgi:putative tricarboxylic transport membrane protein|nr:tripartite tricarboxylate transporter permease [Candidatus Limnocylindria bacterium]